MSEVGSSFRYGHEARHEDHELDVEQCWSLLGSTGIGRFAFVDDGRVAVYPVRYLVHSGALYFRTTPDGTVARGLPQGGVALQLDAADPATQSGWSVLVSGRAEAVHDSDELTALFGEMVEEPWAGGVRDHFVRIDADRLTGRRVYLAR
ncbi:pyridoxamine 5'-phosphate oxidase family protein [Sinomonas sp. ASV486]|uniref:Pyridoxamine 5'-phosphate oxidase family protein n=1 Tax=Sinomonas puerhi TaxID=3238584 RepID=A0AB39L1B6_9MICC|nr:pyridoxamine 5'-phosphate oxidase family protein [Sinomonas sp. ASV486]MDQ4488688.1 pyridoxamine 5'-phosphate oxidase family protein [Sinomonas sp. ASV486]